MSIYAKPAFLLLLLLSIQPLQHVEANKEMSKRVKYINVDRKSTDVRAVALIYVSLLFIIIYLLFLIDVL